MTGARSSQVASNDSTARDDGLAAQNDILRTRDGCSTGHFVPSVLHIQSAHAFQTDRNLGLFTYRLDVLSTGVVDRQVHVKARVDGRGWRTRSRRVDARLSC